MSEPLPPVTPATWATDADLEQALGAIGQRPPTYLDKAWHLGLAEGQVRDQLVGVYGDPLPDFTGRGLEVIRYATALTAAASVLTALRSHLPSVGEEPAQLRAQAAALLAGGVPGYVPGSTDPDGPDGPATAAPAGPAHNGGTSAFTDPYDLPTYPPLAGWPW